MSKHIIIDWQRDGLFVAMGSRRGNTVTIDTLVTTNAGPGGSGSSTAISTQLFVLAKQLDLHKSEATVIAPREVLEFRTLTVPRGLADEVPDMVRFQAQRQMANIGDTWPLDYILLPELAGQEGLSALAATISPAHMAEIEGTCSDLGIQLTRVLARPLEIARWGVAVGNLAETEASLVIAVSQTHADLLLVGRGSLLQVRGTRLPEDPAAKTSALVAEIRRSIMAAASDLNNQSITKILLIASPELAERVEATVAQATGASVAIIDPASLLPASLPERHDLALRSANRLAAIAGVIGNPAPDKREIIDLKNCKRREPKKARTREMALAGAALGVILLGGVSWWWSKHAALDQEISLAQAVEKAKKDELAANAKFIKQAADVDKFLAGSINWLDEIAYVAAKIPPAGDVMLTNPELSVLADNSGQIKVTVDAKDAQSISQLEVALSDKTHAVSGSGSKERPQKNGIYAWTSVESIRVTENKWDPLAAPAKASGAAKPAAAAATPATDKPATGNSTTDKPTPASEPQAAAAPAAVPAATTPATATPAASVTAAAPVPAAAGPAALSQEASPTSATPADSTTANPAPTPAPTTAPPEATSPTDSAPAEKAAPQ